MKTLFLIYLTFVCLSCGKEKILQLPEIKHSKTTEINDVSPAYLFYNEALPDSIELNRKNLIGTTNWLVNVDKRLTLKQAIPSIMMLQNKKRNAQMHKNEAARNYFTCSNTTTKKLGFIDFTDVVFHKEVSNTHINEIERKSNIGQLITIKVYTLDSISVEFSRKGTLLIHSSNSIELLKHITANHANNDSVMISSGFNDKLLFQDYITYKTLLSELDIKNMTIAIDEFIFN